MITARLSDMAGEKPAYGSPCNGCGGCCLAEVCPAGRAVLGTRTAPCPALERRQEGGTYGCGLILHPERYSPSRTFVHGREKMAAAATEMIGVNGSCDCRTVEETPEVTAEITRRLDAAARRKQPAVARARKLWGV